MAYDENLAQRVRGILACREGVSERKMFGGLAFMLNGNMFCGVVGRDLMVRVGPERYEDALRMPHARVMDFTGRPLRGMVYVGPAALETDQALDRWIEEGLSFAASLPRK